MGLKARVLHLDCIPSRGWEGNDWKAGKAHTSTFVCDVIVVLSVFFVVGDRTNALIECEDEAADDGGAVVECEAFPCFPKKTSACAGGRFKPGDAGRFRGVFVFVACGGS